MKPNLDDIRAALDNFNQTPLTAALKAKIQGWADALGVSVRKNTGCRNCWHDALIQMYYILRHAGGEEPARAYRFKHRGPVIVAGRRYSADTALATIEALRRSRPSVYAMLFEEVKPAATTDQEPVSEAPAEEETEQAETEEPAPAEPAEEASEAPATEGETETTEQEPTETTTDETDSTPQAGVTGVED